MLGGGFGAWVLQSALRQYNVDRNIANPTFGGGLAVPPSPPLSRVVWCCPSSYVLRTTPDNTPSSASLSVRSHPQTSDSRFGRERPCPRNDCVLLGQGTPFGKPNSVPKSRPSVARARFARAGFSLILAGLKVKNLKCC